MVTWWSRKVTDQEVFWAHSAFVALAVFQVLDATAKAMPVMAVVFAVLALALCCSAGFGLLIQLQALLLTVLVGERAGRRYTDGAQKWWQRVDCVWTTGPTFVRPGAWWPVKPYPGLSRRPRSTPRVFRRPSHRARRVRQGKGGTCREEAPSEGPSDRPFSLIIAYFQNTRQLCRSLRYSGRVFLSTTASSRQVRSYVLGHSS